jgi:hypothetical protein
MHFAGCAAAGVEAAEGPSLALSITRSRTLLLVTTWAQCTLYLLTLNRCIFRVQRAAALARGLGRPPRSTPGGRSGSRGGGRGATSGRGRRTRGAATSAAPVSGSDDTAVSSGSESPAEDASNDATAAIDSDSANRPGELRAVCTHLHQPSLPLARTRHTSDHQPDPDGCL